MDGLKTLKENKQASRQEVLLPQEGKLSRIASLHQPGEQSDTLASYFARPVDTNRLVLAQPGTIEEVQEIMMLASELARPILTLNDRYLDPNQAAQKAIVLDMSRLTAIEKIDQRNLVVHIQRGVTFRALMKELDALGLKLATPLAATSDSVLANFVNRVPLKKATLYAEPHVANMQVVLADGRLFKTGSHALSEAADLKEDGGPSLSRWFHGSEDIFGIITRATLNLYPKTECRDVLVFGFDSLEATVKALRNGPRTEQGWEYLALNRRFFSNLLGGETRSPAPWTLVVGFDGKEKLVAFQKLQVTKILKELGGHPIESYIDEFRKLLDEVWYPAAPMHTGFYSPCNRVTVYHHLIRKQVSEAGLDPAKTGCCLLAVDRGRCLYSQYDFFGDSSQHQGLVTSINRVLAAEGAFFDRPSENISHEILDQSPNLLKHIRTVKSIMDPQGIINPGRFVSPEAPLYIPLAVEVQTTEATGIEKNNLAVVEKKLSDAIGAEWVSANPTDLAAYGRDFTIFSGERPNLVVLPKSTDDVQKIMRIAYSHKIPVIPLTTGFNHGGLTIPRKGGILVDLKRMNRLVAIDEETLTATFEPGVRMRSLWHECQNITTFKKIKLKPILPLTLASISLLSNYVSRGGPGSAVKYGFSTDLAVNMTWVMPNGEILRTGPSSLPRIGNLGITWGPGPDISGMFFNADGAFGICTEITVNLYPDLPHEHMIQTAIFDDDPVGCEKACNVIYDLAQQSLVEFVYKSHPGVMCVALAGIMDANPVDLVSMVPKHPLFMIISGFNEEEIQVRLELIREVLSRYDVMELDPAIFGPEFSELITTEPLKASVGVTNNTVGAHQGAFQWQAGYIKIEKIPEINQAYKKLIKKYWKTSDVNVTMEAALTGTDIQGPLPYARLGTVEFDYWWDQGNPEAVKRASIMIRKTTELLFSYGAIPIRNMFGFGELLLPQLAVYQDILKQLRRTFDPANLMHPDVLPITDDYV